jgi:hypothetical protein
VELEEYLILMVLLRLKFQQGLVPSHCRKTLLAVSEDWQAARLLQEVRSVFELKDEVYLEVGGYCLSGNVGVLLLADQKLTVSRVHPLSEPDLTRLSKASALTRPLPSKRPRSISESSSEPRSVPLKASEPRKVPQKASEADKKEVAKTRRQMKRAPVLQQFTGKRVKFDAEGRREVVDKPALRLNVLSPAEEFAKKKESWRTPTNQLAHKAYQRPALPVVTREDSSSDDGSDPPSHESSDYDKPKIKRFGEYQVDKGSIIPEIYKYDITDYQSCISSSLVTGDVILFRTLELNDATLTPVLSSYKVSSIQKGQVNWVDDTNVNIKLLREYLDEELEWLKDQEVIDEHILEKYELTLEKSLLAYLMRKTETSDMDTK